MSAPLDPLWKLKLRLGNPLALGIALALSASPAHADWVSLHSGEYLRGIDIKRHGKDYRFTLESGETIDVAASNLRHHEKSPPAEKVEFRGKEVSLREKVRTLQEEQKARDLRFVQLIEVWARGKEGAEAAEKEIVALPSAEQERYLGRALRESRYGGTRRFAARRLGDIKSAPAKRSLVEAALQDEYRSVRDTSLVALKVHGDSSTGASFIPGLGHPSPSVRTRAANALAVFPDRRAVPALIDTVRIAAQGFGRGYMMQVTQRAYIADYELVSGGTGFSIVEVADPVVQTSLTGVILDVKVQQAEIIASLRALHRITGQDFGTDVAKWKAWWEANKDA
jgi:hypothetical protein